MSYDDIVEICETDINFANWLLKKNWKLINTYTIVLSEDSPNDLMMKYSIGRPAYSNYTLEQAQKEYYNN